MITALYASLLTFLYVGLAFRVIAVRFNQQVGLGDAGDPALRRRIRAHGNFGEYVPLGLILIALAEMMGSPVLLLHGIGASLACGRLLHAYGLSGNSEASVGRGVGMILTFGALLTGAGVCLVGFALSGFPSL